ncbi:GNAT family N-acetyltransferase [Jannaschia sp. M317]|uniref:GNAT family N-acetyltransferase n=1 Tax=Jannaschia sp. M317 TaxID=2867011 RepID=UPI0021A74346|nr:GNAT family N-acetyltransferase [Jannaschia sp. M317]UWQ19161.1 GNAT family N-acetyltransferase [Jannaschia sp. M317]
MFLRSNLAAHGLRGTYPHATRFWTDGTAVLGLTRAGFALPFAPDGWDVNRAAHAMSGMDLNGIIGPAAVARPLLAACGLSQAPMQRNDDAPQMGLSLDALVTPDGPGKLVPLDAHAGQAALWRLAANREAEAGAQDIEGARAEVARWIAQDRGRLLIDGDTPLALTGLNAALPDIVQVGGVYVPPARRGARLAGRAVALDLDRRRALGVTRATLFADSVQALRSYARLGFVRTGTVALILFDGPQRAV